MEPIIFDHIASKEEKGKELNEHGFISFSVGIAMKLLEETGDKILAAARLLSSDTPCLVAKEKLYIVPISMYPEHAKLSDEERIEGLSLASSIGRKLYSYPLSLASITDDPSKKISGASYLVRVGKAEEISG